MVGKLIFRAMDIILPWLYPRIWGTSDLLLILQVQNCTTDVLSHHIELAN
jgi:hypothetical protein